MEAHQVNHAVPCRCGGQAKIFGPSEFAPGSQWGVYCSRNGCAKMATGKNLDQVIDVWNEEQMYVIY